MKSRVVTLILSGSAAVVAAGCASEGADVSYEAISGDLTPELTATVNRHVDADRHLAYTNNANARSFWDDAARMFYVDHPSRLSPFPVIDASGQPR